MPSHRSRGATGKARHSLLIEEAIDLDEGRVGPTVRDHHLLAVLVRDGFAGLRGVELHDDQLFTPIECWLAA